MTLDPRLNAIRDDLADRRLEGTVSRPHYADPRPALITAGLAPVHHSPDATSGIDTYYFRGEAIRVFDQAGDYCWCQSDHDGYVGYVDRRFVSVDPDLGDPWFVATMGSYTYRHPDLRTAVADFIPRHGRVDVSQRGIVTRGTRYAALADGSFITESALAKEPPHSLALTEAAARYLGCPYLWGGKSFLGIDCTGLVQNSFRDLSVAVRRDSDMQRETIGSPIPIASIDGLQPDDLLFIPGHVMVHEGGGSVIHADGATMTVRREPLAEFLVRNNMDVTALTVRRPDPVAR